jgi:hypothetical protein
MRFYGILWGSMKFYDVPVNQSVSTEANRGLTSYIHDLLTSLLEMMRQRPYVLLL